MLNAIPPAPSAITAIQTGIREHNNTAARVTNSPADGELPNDVLKMKITKHAVSANIAVVKASQEVMRQTVDIVA